MHLIVVNHDIGLEVLGQVFDFTRKWEHDAVAFPILCWYFRLLRTLMICSLAAISCFGTLWICTPVIFYAFTGKMIVAAELYLPLVDYRKHPGFEMHLVFHAFCIFFSIIGIASVTFQILTLFVSLCSQIDILSERVTALAEYIRNNHEKWKDNKSDEILVKTLRDIYEDHQSTIEFLDNLEDLLSYQQMTDHMFFGFQICLALFIVMQEVWIPGYYIVISGTFIVFTIDALGTIIDVKLEKFSAKTYDVPWYLMTVKDQKNFCFFLAHTQSCDRLTLYGRLPLNLDTFVRFYKGIYSYLMILREVEN
ncbi:odorant receptor 67d-like [Culicoides brevitarsis]|uniref:odorant receptor 67d-like n=1 Tax=Culicoides brevitarsis TaxID=469753 RepID=UPI00307B7838